MGIIIAIQPPYSLLVGFDTYLDKEMTKFNYKSVVLHLVLITIEITFDHDDEVL